MQPLLLAMLVARVIGRRLARQHLVGTRLLLYDLTSTWLTGRCELAARGHSRDGTPNNIDELVKRADILLYDAKQKGKNMICHEVVRS